MSRLAHKLLSFTLVGFLVAPPQVWAFTSSNHQWRTKSVRAAYKPKVSRAPQARPQQKSSKKRRVASVDVREPRLKETITPETRLVRSGNRDFLVYHKANHAGRGSKHILIGSGFREIRVDTKGHGRADFYEVKSGKTTVSASNPFMGHYLNVKVVKEYSRGRLIANLFYQNDGKYYLEHVKFVPERQDNSSAQLFVGAACELGDDDKANNSAFFKMIDAVQKGSDASGSNESAIACKISRLRRLFFAPSCFSDPGFAASMDDMINGMAKVVASSSDLNGSYLQCLDNLKMAPLSAQIRGAITEKFMGVDNMLKMSGASADAIQNAINAAPDIPGQCDELKTVDGIDLSTLAPNAGIARGAYMMKCDHAKENKSSSSYITREITLRADKTNNIDWNLHRVPSGDSDADARAYASAIFHEMCHMGGMSPDGEYESQVANIEKCCSPNNENSFSRTTPKVGCMAVKDWLNLGSNIASVEQAFSSKLLSPTAYSDVNKDLLRLLADSDRPDPDSDSQTIMDAYKVYLADGVDAANTAMQTQGCEVQDTQEQKDKCALIYYTALKNRSDDFFRGSRSKCDLVLLGLQNNSRMDKDKTNTNYAPVRTHICGKFHDDIDEKLMPLKPVPGWVDAPADPPPPTNPVAPPPPAQPVTAPQAPAKPVTPAPQKNSGFDPMSFVKKGVGVVQGIIDPNSRKPQPQAPQRTQARAPAQPQVAPPVVPQAAAPTPSPTPKKKVWGIIGYVLRPFQGNQSESSATVTTDDTNSTPGHGDDSTEVVTKNSMNGNSVSTDGLTKLDNSSQVLPTDVRDPAPLPVTPPPEPVTSADRVDLTQPTAPSPTHTKTHTGDDDIQLTQTTVAQTPEVTLSQNSPPPIPTISTGRSSAQTKTPTSPKPVVPPPSQVFAPSADSFSVTDVVAKADGTVTPAGAVAKPSAIMVGGIDTVDQLPPSSETVNNKAAANPPTVAAPAPVVTEPSAPPPREVASNSSNIPLGSTRDSSGNTRQDETVYEHSSDGIVRSVASTGEKIAGAFSGFMDKVGATLPSAQARVADSSGSPLPSINNPITPQIDNTSAGTVTDLNAARNGSGAGATGSFVSSSSLRGHSSGPVSLTPGKAPVVMRPSAVASKAVSAGGGSASAGGNSGDGLLGESGGSGVSSLATAAAGDGAAPADGKDPSDKKDAKAQRSMASTDGAPMISTGPIVSRGGGSPEVVSQITGSYDGYLAWMSDTTAARRYLIDHAMRVIDKNAVYGSSRPVQCFVYSDEHAKILPKAITKPSDCHK